MLEFAQSAGVLPGDQGKALGAAEVAAAPAGDATLQQQPQTQDQQHQQFLVQQQGPQPMDISGVGDQAPLVAPAMVAVNSAADAAVEDAERALAQARGTVSRWWWSGDGGACTRLQSMIPGASCLSCPAATRPHRHHGPPPPSLPLQVAVLAGFDQQASSRSTSYGQGTPTGDEAAGGSAGGSIGIVRRAARRGTRGTDQSYASGGGGGGGGGGGVYGSGGYGSGGGGGGAYSGGSGGFAQQQVGPLGFAPSERTGGKQGKGLRHFSMKVCEKVESKGTTTYNEVADELVAEMKDSQLEDGVVYDEKNIRRRVYDAINVLMALDVIAKEKKAIIWRGFHAGAAGVTTTAAAAPGGSAAVRPTVGLGAISRAQDARAAAAAAVDKKAAFLADLLEQQRALKALMARNAAAPAAAAAPSGTQLDLPFILVQAKPDATVEVQISDDMRDVQFDFSKCVCDGSWDGWVVWCGILF